MALDVGGMVSRTPFMRRMALSADHVYHHGSMCYDGSMVEHEGSNEKPLSVQLPAVRASLDQAGRDAPCTLSELQAATLGHDSPEAPEEWREITGTSAMYEVSNRGRVRSYAKRGRHSGLPVDTPTILTGHKDCHGYSKQTIRMSDGKPRPTMVARLVAEAFIGKRPDGLFVAHKNGNKDDNRVENLLYCTLTENNNHKFVHGTVRTGERHPNSKITELGAMEIRSRYRGGESSAKLAKEFGLTVSTVWRIGTNRLWVDKELLAQKAIESINFIRGVSPDAPSSLELPSPHSRSDISKAIWDRKPQEKKEQMWAKASKVWYSLPREERVRRSKMMSDIRYGRREK